VGDGGTVNGTDEGNTVIDYNGLVNTHMKGYPTAIAKGVSTIMVSYSAWNGVRMHANRFLLTDVLKNQLGFKGFLISDWEGIDRITPTWGSNYSYSVLAGVTAGIDMVSHASLTLAMLSVMRPTDKYSPTSSCLWV
jgi:beta-glucosidase-like glycosyl hydrolase